MINNKKTVAAQFIARMMFLYNTRAINCAATVFLLFLCNTRAINCAATVFLLFLCNTRAINCAATGVLMLLYNTRAINCAATVFLLFLCNTRAINCAVTVRVGDAAGASWVIVSSNHNNGWTVRITVIGDLRNSHSCWTCGTVRHTLNAASRTHKMVHIKNMQ